jgi:hypothetical protein
MRVISAAAILIVLFALGVMSACAYSAFRAWEIVSRPALHDPYYLIEAARQLIVFAVFAIIHIGAVFACLRFFVASRLGRASAWTFLGGLVLFSAGQFLTIWPFDFNAVPERYVEWELVRSLLQASSLLALSGMILFVVGWILLIIAATQRTRIASRAGRA